MVPERKGLEQEVEIDTQKWIVQKIKKGSLVCQKGSGLGGNQ